MSEVTLYTSILTANLPGVRGGERRVYVHRGQNEGDKKGIFIGKEFQFKTFRQRSLLHSMIFISNSKAFVQWPS